MDACGVIDPDLLVSGRFDDPAARQHLSDDVRSLTGIAQPTFWVGLVCLNAVFGGEFKIGSVSASSPADGSFRR